MARPLRLEFSGAVYHVTSRGNARHDIVVDDRDRSQFLSLLAHVVDRFGWLCHGVDGVKLRWPRNKKYTRGQVLTSRFS